MVLVKTLAFFVGFLAVTYGVFFTFASGATLQAALWILVGLALQLAGGAASPNGQRGRLENPIEVVTRHLNVLRARVQSWDQRP